MIVLPHFTRSLLLRSLLCWVPVRALTVAAGAVVLTGHETGWVLEAADEVVWMRDGGTQPPGSRDEAVRHWRFRREYLGERS